jgi:hypothetical protein
VPNALKYNLGIKRAMGRCRDLSDSDRDYNGVMKVAAGREFIGS